MSESSEHASHVHIVPLKTLLTVWAALVILTVATVAVTKVDLGSGNLAVALIIATTKATIVALYFMHLRWDKPINTVIFITAIGFVMLFILLVVLDTGVYDVDRIPGYAPAVNR